MPIIFARTLTLLLLLFSVQGFSWWDFFTKSTLFCTNDCQFQSLFWLGKKLKWEDRRNCKIVCYINFVPYFDGLIEESYPVLWVTFHKSRFGFQRYVNPWSNILSKGPFKRTTKTTHWTAGCVSKWGRKFPPWRNYELWLFGRAYDECCFCGITNKVIF